MTKRKTMIRILILMTMVLIYDLKISVSESADLENPKELESDKMVYRVPKIASPIRVDGVIDEVFWNEALKLDANFEVNPGENIPAPVQTEALLAYTNTHIYVAIQAFDPEPSQIRARLCDRDEIWDDDWVLILFDTFNDQRRTYDFVCNPFGIQADMIEASGGGNGSWDGIWESDGCITDEGYIVEMAIPFSSLSFQRTEEDQIWGYDVVRSYPRNVRHHIGSFPRDRNNNCYMCQANKLIGFTGAKPGKNFELDPTLSLVNVQERKDENIGPFIQKEQEFEPGLTAQWSITPNMKLNGTLNPDFSQVETDITQFDINRRFALYYPEKRPFFLEGADFLSTRFNIIHTRTLANPTWGVKITGKERSHAIGYFTVQDEITTLLFPGSEGSDDTSIDMKSIGSVLRYRKDIGKSSNIGLLVTDREGENYYNRLGSIDGILKFTQKDQLQFQIMKSTSRYPDSTAIGFDQPTNEFGGTGFHAYYCHNTKHVYLYGLYNELHPDFRADLGFMSQVGYRYSEIGCEYKWQKDPGYWYTWLSLYGSYDMRRDYNYGLLHKAYTARFYYEGPLQSYFGCYGEYGKNRYEGQSFVMNYIDFWGGLKPTKNLGIYANGHYGDEIDYDHCHPGIRFRVEPTIEYRLGLHLIFSYSHNYERMTVENGLLYTARINYLRAIYQFSRRTFLRIILQHRSYLRNLELYEDDVNHQEDAIASQILFSYKINPQTVFFLGYSDNYYGDDDLRIRQTNRSFFAKFGYAWRL